MTVMKLMMMMAFVMLVRRQRINIKIIKAEARDDGDNAEDDYVQ